MSIQAKIGGIVLTGIGAYLITSKALDILDRSIANAAEASKWRAYYGCWSKGKYDGEPIAPGYSYTTQMADGMERVQDPTGTNYSKDQENKSKNEKVAEAVTEAVKDVCDIMTGKSRKGADEAREALEGQTEAFKENKTSQPTDPDKEGIENVIDGLFRAENMEMSGDAENDISSDNSTDQSEKETENHEYETLD